MNTSRIVRKFSMFSSKFSNISPSTQLFNSKFRVVLLIIPLILDGLENLSHGIYTCRCKPSHVIRKNSFSVTVTTDPSLPNKIKFCFKARTVFLQTVSHIDHHIGTKCMWANYKHETHKTYDVVEYMKINFYLQKCICKFDFNRHQSPFHIAVVTNLRS